MGPKRSFKAFTSLVIIGLSAGLRAQTAPLETPKVVEYPGIIQTFEKLIQIDNDKFQKRSDLLTRSGRTFEDLKGITNLELEPDFLNSIILHSDPGYLRMAATNKCRFYESILTDLLKSSEGKIRNVQMTYVEKGYQQSALVSKKDFLNKVVNAECPETQKMISLFQVKTLNDALKDINFEIPSGREQCRLIHLDWVNNPKTPFLCQIYEYVKEAKAGQGDPKDLAQRKAVAKILESKQTLVQQDYIENICKHLDDEEIFCDEFLNVSFWTKIAAGYENKIYAEDICRKALNKNEINNDQYGACLARIKKENDLCLYPGGIASGIRPQPECDQLSTALNFSSYNANYKDCPGDSDQLVITNTARIINFFSNKPTPVPAGGPCSGVSAMQTYDFNKNFDNEESWKLEACYDDRLKEREVCYKTFFLQDARPEAYTSVVAQILKNTKGALESQTCEMISTTDYNPLLLKYKSGCYIIYDRNECFISHCKHKIIFNERTIDFIKVRGSAEMPYFPLTVREERFSQHYLFTHDFKKKGRALNNLSSMETYFKKSQKGIIHGVGCAEDLMATFFKTQSLNQCTPMPFMITGVISEKDKTVFVTTTAADALQAPRLISWSNIFSAVKAYQRTHPLKLWTLYALD